MTTTQTQINETDLALIEMLTENTGRHFLDSGGAYGRHWERNQYRDFMSEPATLLDFRYGIEVTHNLFHWLRDRIAYEPERDDLFRTWREHDVTTDREYTSHLQDMADFVSMLTEINEHDVLVMADETTRAMLPASGWLQRVEVYSDAANDATAMFGRAREVITNNSYNGEDLLSQIIQYTIWTDTQTLEEYVLLQIHGGCDARGGYTAPRLFAVREEYALFDNARAIISCAGHDLTLLDGSRYRREPHHWFTDDAYHYYRDGVAGFGASTRLEEYDVVEIESNMEWIQGKLCHYPDPDAASTRHIGLCPVCGSPLTASMI